MTLHLSLLGPPQLFEGEKLVTQVPRKAMAMAAYLAVQKTALERSKVADLLWEGDEESVRRNLRQELFRLKGTVWEEVVVQSPQTLTLGDVGSDLDQFLLHLSRGAWAEATALWRGGFLAGFDPKAPEPFWDWLIPERERWEGLYREAVLGLARNLEAGGNYAEALRQYQALLAQDPLQEALQQAAIRLLFLKGERGAALKQFEQYCELLRSQLGLEPSPETRQMVERLRAGQEVHPATAGEPTPALVEPPLVGRAEDWDWLERRFGQGLLLLLGEAGVGKSRLAQEYSRYRVGGGPCEVLRAVQRESGQGIGFGGLLEALRQALEAGRLNALEPTWREALAPLLPELGTPQPQGEGGKARLFEALTRAVQLAVRPGGVLLWEDLHWLDWASLEFLPYLVRRAGALGFAVIATSRGEGGLGAALHELRAEGRLHLRVLEALSLPSLIQLLRQLSGQQEGGELFAERLYRATEGNVYFVLETLRYLFEKGLLRSERSAWHTPFDQFTTDYRELPVPPSVREALLGRLRNLGEAAKGMVQAIALADFPLSPEAVVSLGSQLGASLGDLDLLQGGGFLRLDDAGYALRHELARQAVLAELSPSRKGWLHLRIAQVLRQTGGSLSQLALHLEAAGQRSEAFAAHLSAARALRRGPLATQALEHFHKAQDLLPPDLPDAERFRLLIETAETRVALGQAHFNERRQLQRLALELGASERFRLYLLDADAALASGQVEEGIAAVGEALELAQSPTQRGHALFKLAWLEYRGGNPDAQLGPLNEAIRSFEAAGDTAMEALAVRNLSGYWFRLGDLGQHQRAYNRAWQLASEMEDALLLRRLRADKGLVGMIKGDYIGSLELARQIEAEARERGDWWALWDALQLELLGAAIFGLEPGLEAAAREAMAQAAELGSKRDLALLRLNLGMAYLTENRLTDAEAELRAALEDFGQMGEKAMLGHSLFFLGYTLLERGDFEASRQLQQHSVDIWADRREDRHQARSLSGLTLAYLRQGKRREALEASARAYQLHAPWAMNLYDTPLVLYARARALGDKEGQGLLEQTQAALRQLAQGLPKDYAARFVANRFVAWAMSKRA
ncbi:MAG: BTAD domain-containing putative transcriptional regulator [Meiothermus sp.]|nr:BTAD domain-containing putative transcriptional regulator [Meiothermus sp.]